MVKRADCLTDYFKYAKDNLSQKIQKLQARITQVKAGDHMPDLQVTELVLQLENQRLQLQDLDFQQSRWRKIRSPNI